MHDPSYMKYKVFEKSNIILKYIVDPKTGERIEHNKNKPRDLLNTTLSKTNVDQLKKNIESWIII